MLSFISMAMRRVEPFAIYAAERDLRAAGVSVKRQRLIAHYLLTGDVQPLVRELIAANATDALDKNEIDAIVARLLVNSFDPSAFASRRIVAPVRSGIAILTLFCLTLLIPLSLWRPAAFLDDVYWPAIIAGGVVIVTAVFAFTFIAARLGMRAAETMVAVALLLIILGIAVVWQAQT